MTDRLRLAVDARDLATDTRGIGRYARAILRRLARRDDIELTLLVFGALPFLHRKALAAAIGESRFRLATRPHGCDVVWHPGNGTFFRSSLPNVVTVHDAAPFRFPESDPARRKSQQEPFLRSVRQAARIITVSQFGRDEVYDIFGFPAERMDVIYHGVDPFFTPGEPTGERSYYLFVGNPTEERKNFAVLCDAHCAAFPAGDPPLMVVGPPHLRSNRVRYARSSGDEGTPVDDAQLRELYRGAIALCLPSLYEGFGMPAIEAMACGTPVLAASASCLPEVAGDAALYAPADDRAAWKRALAQIAEQPDLRERFRVAGIAHARRFDWDESARQHAEVFLSLR